MRSLLSGSADVANFAHGRRPDADRKASAELRPGQGQGTRAKVQEERIHDQGLRRADQGDQENGLARRLDRDDPRAQESRGRGGFRGRETRTLAYPGDYRFDDASGARQSSGNKWPPAHAYRYRQRDFGP